MKAFPKLQYTGDFLPGLLLSMWLIVCLDIYELTGLIAHKVMRMILPSSGGKKKLAVDTSGCVSRPIAEATSPTFCSTGV